MHGNIKLPQGITKVATQGEHATSRDGQPDEDGLPHKLGLNRRGIADLLCNLVAACRGDFPHGVRHEATLPRRNGTCGAQSRTHDVLRKAVGLVPSSDHWTAVGTPRRDNARQICASITNQQKRRVSGITPRC